MLNKTELRNRIAAALEAGVITRRDAIDASDALIGGYLEGVDRGLAKVGY